MNIKQIATKAGVSVATVSRVLNHPNSVAPKTKEKIKKIISEEEYTPNWFARGLNLKKTGTIGIIIPHIVDSVHMETAKGIEDVAHEKGYITFMCNAEEDVEKEKQYIQQLVKRKVDGIILISSYLEEEEIKGVVSEGVPIVLVGGSKCNLKLNKVSIDCEQGAYEATSYLIKLGYKKIVMLSSEDKSQETMDKVKGYKKALKENSILFDDENLIHVENSIEGGYLRVKKLLTAKKRPEAIFASNDLIAFGAMDSVKEAGLNVPKDVAVVGFDNIRLSNLVEPKLTTIDAPLHKMGILGANLLFDAIEEPEYMEARSILLQTKMKIRKSCGDKDRIGEMF